MSDALLDSLRAAVAASPDDVELRIHLAELLLAAGLGAEAVENLGSALRTHPADERVRALMLRALAPDAGAASAPAQDAAPGPASAPATGPAGGFDWSQAESEVEDLAAPMFVGGDEAASAFDVESSGVVLADVGGMTAVKHRLESAFLAPLKNPELRALYGKSLRGGMLMYGPPGCGKTFIARAVAGELGASFISVGISSILDMYMGTSERNVHELFQLARREAPCVVFLDELDAIGQRRSLSRNSGLRGVVVSLLEELDGVATDNEGVFVLAATNQPWDVDPALRRPGRLDRTVLVLPPDAPAREAIFRHHLSGRPIEGIDLGRLASRTDGFSGADIAYACEVASEKALMASVASGTPRMIGMPDLLAAVSEISPSTGPWLESARTVVSFGEDDGTFGELRAYLKSVKRW